MADFKIAIIKTLMLEGGSILVNNPNDRGGLTRFGICQRSYPDVDIEALTEQDAKAIYRRDYWLKIGGDEINNQLIADTLFDTAVNMGPKTSARLVQMILELDNIDGFIGPKTLAAINQCEEALFMAKFCVAKIARYADICRRDASQKQFLLGWITRAFGGVL